MFTRNGIGSCLTACPARYLNVGGQCQECTAPCKTCAGTVASCLSCHYTYYYLAGSACTQDCGTRNAPPAYYYKDYATLSCRQCALANCVQCVNGIYCLACADGYNFYQNACLVSCLPGLVAVEGRCSSCQAHSLAHCLECIPTACTRCITGFFLSQGACRTSCPNGRYPARSSTGGACQLCVSPCVSCSTLLACESCDYSAKAKYHFAPGKRCLVNCPLGYFAR